MGFNINGATLTAENSAVTIAANSTTGLTFDATHNIPIESSRPYFVAQGTAEWTNYSSASWNTPALNYTLVNNGSHYNTSTYRFTAPVTGTYWFGSCTYTQKNTDTNYNSYTHPTFLINGSQTARQASYTTPYRLRTRTYYSSTHSTDTEINDIFRLTAGDYVQMYIYSSGVLRYRADYAIFTGFLIS